VAGKLGNCLAGYVVTRRLPGWADFRKWNAWVVLHRDIFWLGRQWAVTGLGIQAVSRKLEGKFDVEVSRLWDEDLAQALSSEPWFDIDDFTEALELARKRFSETPIRFKAHPTDE